MTRKPYGEFWGVSFEADQRAAFVNAVSEASLKFENGLIPRDNSWSVYLEMNPECVWDGEKYGRADCWREVDDWTEDFDFPKDWDRWNRARILAPKRKVSPEMEKRIGDEFCLISLTRDSGCAAWRHIIGEWGYRRDWKYLEVGGCSELTQGRSEAISTWLLRTKKRWAVWIDDDMVINWDDLLVFCATALEQADNLDVLLGVAVSKNQKSGKLCCFPVADEIRIGDGGDVLPVKGGGVALGAVKRDLCERMIATSPKVRYSSGTPGWPLFASIIAPFPEDKECPFRHCSEDISFCHRVEAFKGRMYADTRIRVGHRGPYVYYPEDALDAVELKPTIRFKVR